MSNLRCRQAVYQTCSQTSQAVSTSSSCPASNRHTSPSTESTKCPRSRTKVRLTMYNTDICAGLHRCCWLHHSAHLTALAGSQRRQYCLTELWFYAPHTPFNGPFSGTTQVSRYQKGKTNLDFTEARDSEWQWHQLGRTQVCTSLQTDNHASTPPVTVFYRPDALPAAQPTASKH